MFLVQDIDGTRLPSHTLFIPILEKPISRRIESMLDNTGNNKWFASDISIAGTIVGFKGGFEGDSKDAPEITLHA